MLETDFQQSLFPDYDYVNPMLTLKIDRDSEPPKGGRKRQLVTYSPDTLVESVDRLIAVAESLVKLANDELNELAKYSPNSDENIKKKKQQMDIMEEFRDGFRKIANSLRLLKSDPGEQESTQLTINQVGSNLEKHWSVVENWWAEDGARGFMTRSSLSMAAISFFGWTGAPLTLVTPVVLGSVFGKQILSSVKDR
jgi:hypothetical protein